ncbi:hypothetical protein PDJAM_G00217350 [Pangasius djambal]|uniref:Uncharacterized protein n=1 Tax=Pangasius djambal TaxID=1691987 RepID=A0ACC5YC43_9TELE|nr:hypothetical protein [Pangasius djambal]
MDCLCFCLCLGVCLSLSDLLFTSESSSQSSTLKPVLGTDRVCVCVCVLMIFVLDVWMRWSAGAVWVPDQDFNQSFLQLRSFSSVFSPSVSHPVKFPLSHWDSIWSVLDTSVFSLYSRASVFQSSSVYLSL